MAVVVIRRLQQLERDESDAHCYLRLSVIVESKKLKEAADENCDVVGT